MAKIVQSTPWFGITLWLVQNVRWIHHMELFITCVGLSITWLYPDDNVSESSSWPWRLAKSFFYHLEQRVLKWPVTIEQSVSLPFKSLSLRSLCKIAQKCLNSSWCARGTVNASKKTFSILWTNLGRCWYHLLKVKECYL